MIINPNFIEIEALYHQEKLREAQKQQLVRALRADDRAARPSLWQRLRLSISSRSSVPTYDYVPPAVAIEVTRR